jgi:CRISPR-associated endoribonuclease Cas6
MKLSHAQLRLCYDKVLVRLLLKTGCIMGTAGNGNNSNKTAEQPTAPVPERLASLVIKLDVSPDTFKMRLCEMGPYFQGVLMESLESTYATTLHESSFNPYSIRLSEADGNVEWTIHTLTAEAERNIIDHLLSSTFASITLRSQANRSTPIVSKTVTYLEHQQLVRLFYSKPTESKILIRFLTPTAFRQSNQYVFHPDLRLLFQSLMMRYGAIVENNKEPDEAMLQELLKHTRISSYRLHSQYFPIEKVRIPAFLGSLTLTVNGADSLMSYILMLLRFGEFSGVGIKTAMGMGAISLLQKEAVARANG